ncbi:HTH CENPB-type domain-containing protein [Aphis craccivora]|uniref:HTH CENPB-type domain-containing protein n=1 Tax=Aphis craccivora TaxID=307492 RepID=A0A6G0YV37_APHCR|nr:HTH CENPB-type domain-containing protein [Aphis craccivora]
MIAMMSKNLYFRFKYAQAELISAISSIKYKEKTLNDILRESGITRFTLSTKINKKVPKNRKMVPPTVLSVSKEKRIVKWILAKANVGFPRNPKILKDSIQKFFKDSNKPNLFTDDRPGKKWFSLFPLRHQNIAKRNTELISKSRAAVTETSIRYYSLLMFYYI